MDTDEQIKIISKIQNDINYNCSDIRQCLYTGFQNDFQLNEAQSLDLPFHLKKTKEYIENFFNPDEQSPAPCINFIKHLPVDLFDELYIEEIQKRCLCTKPFSTIVIIEPEAYLTTSQSQLEFAGFIAEVINNNRQAIIHTDSQTIINEFSRKFSAANKTENIFTII